MPILLDRAPGTSMRIVPYGLDGMRDIWFPAPKGTRFSGFGLKERISSSLGVDLMARMRCRSELRFHAVIRQVFRRADSIFPLLVAGKSQHGPVAGSSSSFSRCREGACDR